MKKGLIKIALITGLLFISAPVFGATGGQMVSASFGSISSPDTSVITCHTYSLCNAAFSALTYPITITSSSFFQAFPTNAILTSISLSGCGSQPLVKAYNTYFGLPSSAAIGFVSYTDNNSYICSSAPTFSETGAGYADMSFQYLPYDISVENPTKGDRISYYDWLIPTGIIIFILSIFIFYPLIEDLFIHKKHDY